MADAGRRSRLSKDRMSSSQDPRSSSDRSFSSSRRPGGRKGLDLEVLDARFAICRLEGDADVPAWANAGSFSTISRSADELSIVCEQKNVPQEVECQRGWRAIKVVGPLDFSLVGVLASLALPLAKARISLFAVSTFDPLTLLGTFVALLGAALAACLLPALAATRIDPSGTLRSE